VTTLTTKSSNTAASRRRMRYLTTVLGYGGRRESLAGHRLPSPAFVVSRAVRCYFLTPIAVYSYMPYPSVTPTFVMFGGR
jgi:hypothetical protein